MFTLASWGSTFPLIALISKLTTKEYQQCLKLLDKYGFEDGWGQETEDIEGTFVPDFTKKASWN